MRRLKRGWMEKKACIGVIVVIVPVYTRVSLSGYRTVHSIGDADTPRPLFMGGDAEYAFVRATTPRPARKK